MNKNHMHEALIKIKGIQRNRDGQDCVECETVGSYGCEKDRVCIVYDDGAALGVPGVTTTVFIDGGSKVDVVRSGNLDGRLTVEKGRRNLCFYQMPMGLAATLGVFGKKIDNGLSSDGGRLYMSYTIDLNNSLVSANELEISVREVKQ